MQRYKAADDGDIDSNNESALNEEDKVNDSKGEDQMRENSIFEKSNDQHPEDTDVLEQYDDEAFEEEKPAPVIDAKAENSNADETIENSDEALVDVAEDAQKKEVEPEQIDSLEDANKRKVIEAAAEAAPEETDVAVEAAATRVEEEPVVNAAKRAPRPKIERKSSDSELLALQLEAPKPDASLLNGFKEAGTAVQTLLADSQTEVIRKKKPLLKPLPAPRQSIVQKSITDESLRAALSALKDSDSLDRPDGDETPAPSAIEETPPASAPPEEASSPLSVSQEPSLLQPQEPIILKVLVGTWNMMGRPCPAISLSDFLHPGEFDLYAIGTQECDESIAKAVLKPTNKKPKWHAKLTSALGAGYSLVAHHTMAALNLSIYIRTEMVGWVSNIKKGSVATGIGDVIANKGGVACAFLIGKSNFLFVTSHFTPHEGRAKDRNGDYERIERELVQILIGKENGSSGSRSNSRRGSRSADVEKSQIQQQVLETNQKRVSDYYDFTFWSGDLNYRVRGNRKLVETCLKQDMMEVLLGNEELSQERAASNVFVGYEEGKLEFNPTYKFDPWTDHYDTSGKARIPAWTDRVLWRQKEADTVAQVAYGSVDEIKCSDHRPVYAHFDVVVKFTESDEATSADDKKGSAACVIL